MQIHRFNLTDVGSIEPTIVARCVVVPRGYTLMGTAYLHSQFTSLQSQHLALPLSSFSITFLLHPFPVVKLFQIVLLLDIRSPSAFSCTSKPISAHLESQSAHEVDCEVIYLGCDPYWTRHSSLFTVESRSKTQTAWRNDQTHTS